MGTRHLIAVQLNGEYKIAQYGQWDGHPSGQGATVLAFLRKADLARFAEKVAAVQELSKEEAEAGWIKCGAAPGSSSVRWEIAELHSARFPERSRDTGADILDMVYKAAPGIKLRRQISFAADSLFCEWAYVIDLDTKKLEVFKGFNESPLEEGERFASLPLHEKGGSGTQYYPVKKVAEFDLSALPTKREFLKAAEPQEEAA